MRGYAAIIGVFWQKCAFLPDRATVGFKCRNRRGRSTEPCFASTIGIRLNRDQPLTPKQAPHAERILAAARELGFNPPD
jgi:hypothetical protein